MAKIKGNDLILFIRKEEEYKALAYSTTCEIDIQADTIEIGSPDTGQWTKKKKKRKNWRASSGYLISDSVDAIDVFKTLVGNESVSLIIGTVEPHALSVNADEYVPDERLTIKGDGIITRMTITGKRGDFVTMSIDIEGSGALDIKIKEWIIISPKSIQASPLMSSYKVEVKSNTRWSFSVVKGSDFISYEGKNQGKGNGDAVFKIGTNVSGTTRTGIVRFITENMEGAILKINQESTTPSVSIDQDTLSVIRQGGNYTIHVSANTDWQIDYHPSWVILSQENGGAGEFDITVTVSPNTASTSREDDIGFVTVVEGGEGANCVVTQTAEGNYLYADTNVAALTQEGTSVSIGFNSNLDVTDLEWGSVEGSEWASISVDDNDWVLNISAQSNAGGSTRTGKVFVQTSDGGIRVEITINQAGVAVGTYVKTEPYYYNDHGGTDVMYYQIDTDCSDLVVVYADLPDWLNEITYDNTTKELQVHYIGGISGDPQFLECTLTSESDSSISASFYIGCNNETGDQFAYLLPSLDVHFDVLAWGGSYQVQEWYLFTNGIDSYTLTAPEWATLRDFESPNPAEGGRKVLLMLKANSGETGRTGDLIIQFEGLTVGTLFLSQVSAGDNYIQASTWLAFTYDSSDQVDEVLLTSPLTDLEATVDDDWLNITLFGNTSDEDWNLDYEIQPNTTGKMRETYIRIKSPSAGIELPIYIRQDA